MMTDCSMYITLWSVAYLEWMIFVIAVLVDSEFYQKRLYHVDGVFIKNARSLGTSWLSTIVERYSKEDIEFVLREHENMDWSLAMGGDWVTFDSTNGAQPGFLEDLSASTLIPKSVFEDLQLDYLHRAIQEGSGASTIPIGRVLHYLEYLYHTCDSLWMTVPWRLLSSAGIEDVWRKEQRSGEVIILKDAFNLLHKSTRASRSREITPETRDETDETAVVEETPDMVFSSAAPAASENKECQNSTLVFLSSEDLRTELFLLRKETRLLRA